MKKLKQIWEILNSPIIIACIAFGLTTYLGNRYQERNWQEKQMLEQSRRDYEWEREKKFQILSEKLKEGQRSFDEITDTITDRLLQSQRIVAILQTDNSPDLVTERWSAYVNSVTNWDKKLLINRLKLEILVSRDSAQQLLYYGSYKGPTACLHRNFGLLNNELLKLRELHTQNPNSEFFRKQQVVVARLLEDLSYKIHMFLKKISSSFLKKGSDLLPQPSKTKADTVPE